MSVTPGRRSALALGLLIAAAGTGCRGDKCKDSDPSFQVDVSLPAGVDGGQVKQLVVRVDAAGLHREQILDVAGKIGDGRTSFSVGVGAAGSKGFTAEVTVTARDAAGGAVASGRGTFNGWGNACNFFELALGGGGDGRVDLPDAARDATRDGRSDGLARDARKDGPGDGAKKDAKKADGKPPDAMRPPEACASCPTGWSAVVYNDRSPTGVAVPCPAGWKLSSTAMEGLTDPGCSACTCGAPAGRSCTATFGCHGDAICIVGSSCGGTNTIPGDNSCRDFGCDNICTYKKLTTSGPSGGSCAASGGAVLAVSWAKAHDLCVPASASSCQASCLPPAGSFSGMGCIVQLNDQSCPKGFTTKRVFYSAVSDTRTCSPCTCGPPSGGACASSVVLFPCAACTSGATPPLNVAIGYCTAAQNVQCVAGYPSIRSARYDNSSANLGQCAPSGGAESGSVLETGPVTVCCP